jgi:hypothetical protein
MAVLKFRIYLEEDDSIYRDIAIRHKQTFLELHTAILQAYEFDSKHKATFYRSNDRWQRGKEITLEKYEKNYVVEPLLMSDTNVGTEVFNPSQKFVYEYDFVKGWQFLIELILITKEEDGRLSFPAVVRKEGIAPSQYGTRSIMGDNKLTEVEEKYDLSAVGEGFGTEGGDGDVDAEEEETGLGGEEEAAGGEEEFS